MAIPGAEYWAKRSAARMDHYLWRGNETLDIISKAHKQAQADIQAAIDRIYAKVSKAYGMKPDDVVKMLSQPAGHAEYENLLQTLQGIKNPEIRRPLAARASSGAYAFRVSRLEALRDNVRAQAARLADVELEAVTGGLTSTITDAYNRSMFDLQRGTGFGFSFAQMHTGAVNEILHNPWSGSTFSTRIWQAQDVLAKQLNEKLTAGFMSGKSNAQLSRELADTMGVSYRNAERLVRTETNYMANAAEMKSYGAAGIDQYEYLATLDNRTSEVCQDLDGQVFPCSKARAGENMPPMHPFCRSTTVAHFDDGVVEGMQRRAKDPVTWKPVFVPSGTTYKQWQKIQADTYGPERVALADKMQANASKDRAQFSQYSEILGKTPYTSDFKAFQQMKYLNSEAYSFVKLDYARRSRLASEPSLLLPKADKATAADEKFTKYFFDPASKKGWPKGVAFDSRLGYNKSNWEALQKEFCSKASSYPATFIEQTPFGAKYEQKIVLYGLKGKPANVVIGWMQDGEKTWLTTAMIKEVD